MRVSRCESKLGSGREGGLGIDVLWAEWVVVGVYYRGGVGLE